MNRIEPEYRDAVRRDCDAGYCCGGGGDTSTYIWWDRGRYTISATARFARLRQGITTKIPLWLGSSLPLDFHSFERLHRRLELKVVRESRLSPDTRHSRPRGLTTDRSNVNQIIAGALLEDYLVVATSICESGLECAVWCTRRDNLRADDHRAAVCSHPAA